MAKTHPKANAPITERIITVSSSTAPGRIRPRFDAPEGASIRLDGHWVREAGFPYKSRVRVQIEQGRLVITPA